MKTVVIYQCELNKEIEMELYDRLRYVGKSFGVFGLTDGKICDWVMVCFVLWMMSGRLFISSKKIQGCL